MVRITSEISEVPKDVEMRDGWSIGMVLQKEDTGALLTPKNLVKLVSCCLMAGTWEEPKSD